MASRGKENENADMREDAERKGTSGIVDKKEGVEEENDKEQVEEENEKEQVEEENEKEQVEEENEKEQVEEGGKEDKKKYALETVDEVGAEVAIMTAGVDTPNDKSQAETPKEEVDVSRKRTSSELPGIKE